MMKTTLFFFHKEANNLEKNAGQLDYREKRLNTFCRTLIKSTK